MKTTLSRSFVAKGRREIHLWLGKEMEPREGACLFVLKDGKNKELFVY